MRGLEIATGESVELAMGVRYICEGVSLGVDRGHGWWRALWFCLWWRNEGERGVEWDTYGKGKSCGESLLFRRRPMCKWYRCTS